MLLLVILAVFPSVAVVVYFGYERYQDQLADTVRISQSTLREVSWIQELKQAEVRTVLESLATFSEIRACMPEASREILRQQIAYSPHFLNLFAVDSTGQLFATSTAVEAGIMVNDRKYFRDALRTRSFAAGEYAISRMTGQPCIHFALPLYDNEGRLQVVVGGAVRVEYLRDRRVDALLPAGAQLVITDHAGVVLVSDGDRTDLIGRLDDPEFLQGLDLGIQEGVRHLGQARGKDFWCFHRVLGIGPGSDPYLVARIELPLEVVRTEPLLLLIRDLIVVLIAALLIIALAWLVCERRIVRPLELLAQATRQIGGSTFNPDARILALGGEIGQLGHALGELFHRLNEREEARRQAEERQREEQARLHAALESLPYDLWICDREGRYVMQNSTSVLHWGNRIGRRPEDTHDLPSDLVRLWAENNRRVLAGGDYRG